MIRKGIRITPKKHGLRLEVKEFSTSQMATALSAIAFALKQDAGLSYADILKAVDAGVDGSAFKETQKI